MMVELFLLFDAFRQLDKRSKDIIRLILNADGSGSIVAEAWDFSQEYFIAWDTLEEGVETIERYLERYDN